MDYKESRRVNLNEYIWQDADVYVFWYDTPKEGGCYVAGQFDYELAEYDEQTLKVNASLPSHNLTFQFIDEGVDEDVHRLVKNFYPNGKDLSSCKYGLNQTFYHVLPGKLPRYSSLLQKIASLHKDRFNFLLDPYTVITPELAFGINNENRRLIANLGSYLKYHFTHRTNPVNEYDKKLFLTPEFLSEQYRFFINEIYGNRFFCSSQRTTLELKDKVVYLKDCPVRIVYTSDYIERLDSGGKPIPEEDERGEFVNNENYDKDDPESREFVMQMEPYIFCPRSESALKEYRNGVHKPKPLMCATINGLLTLFELEYQEKYKI